MVKASCGWVVLVIMTVACKHIYVVGAEFSIYTFVGEMLLSNQIFVTQSGMGGGGNGVAVGC